MVPAKRKTNQPRENIDTLATTPKVEGEPKQGDTYIVDTPWGKLDVAASWRMRKAVADDALMVIKQNRTLISALILYANGHRGPKLARDTLVELGVWLPEGKHEIIDIEPEETSMTLADLQKEA
jgi:hypothetical protein